MDREQVKTEQLDLREGTIEFWVREDKIRWNDNHATVLFNIPVNKAGSLFMVKDDDNKLKFFHVILGKGRTDVEVNVSNLALDKPHHIAVTWSLKERKVTLYVDGGELKAEQSITYT